MKQFKLAPLTLGVMLLAGTAAVPAAQGPYIGPTVGYYGFDGDRDNGTEDNGGTLATTNNQDNNADDGVFYGLSLGYQFNDHFALELNYSRMPTEAKAAGTPVGGNQMQTKGSDIDVDMYRLDALFSMPLSKSLSPYFVMGYAHLDFDPEFTEEKHDMVNLGAGAKYSFSKALSLRGDVRGFFDDGYSDYGVNVGLFYLMDTTPPSAPVKAPEVDQCALDDDNDGVGNCDDSCPGTVAASNVDNSGCAVVEDVKAVSFQLEIKFASGKAFVSPDYFSELQRVADALSQNSNATVEIAGYTDSRGRNSANQRLSQRRADAVRDALIAEFGADGSSITAVGYGEENPIADNSTSDGRAENRRVVANIQ